MFKANISVSSCEYCGVFFVSRRVPDPHAGSGKSAPRQHDGQLHQHLPDGGHAGTLEGEEAKHKAGTGEPRAVTSH